MDSTDVLRQWADRSGAYSPDYYAHHGADETSRAIREILDSSVARDATVLEPGCSSGRHLAHLLDNGYENLSGIDVNTEAFDVMAREYPDLAARGTFYVDTIENVVTEFDDGAFDVVYSVETLQHVHPDKAWVFEELARITDDLLVTVENEGNDPDRSNGVAVNYVDGEFPLYYRDWGQIFTDYGFVELDSHESKRDTLRVFEPA